MDEIASETARSPAPVEGGAPHRAEGSAPLVTRRRVLLGVAGLAVAAGAGVTVAAARPTHVHRQSPPPVLVDALAAERGLIASLSASAAVDPSMRSLLNQLADDHRAHAIAISAMLGQYPGAADRARALGGSAGTTAMLRAAERRASAVAARRAGTMSGANATVFASIAACEAGHAELLS